ncbi:MAG TPA: acetoacetate decarboxylase family protein [Longimicrobiaceae bacterium]|nr:acetoacetate decarboxylase family protein [Longimicrobiaceae bacterium]
MAIPRRIRRMAGLHSLVDGIPFTLPVASQRSPALMAAFPINADAAQKLIPGNEIHVLRRGRTGFLLVTVIDYRETNIGKYVEYSVGIACTRGSRPVPLPLAGIFRKTFGTGQYVFDLPVSSLVSVKGGKGIWGMPKHQANLDFIIGDEWVTSRYDLDGKMVMRVEVKKPAKAWLPMSAGAVNWCAFRGMLMKSDIYFRGKLGFSMFKKDDARIVLGDHPRAQALRDLEIGGALFAGYFPETAGTLDDHIEAWFIGYDQAPTVEPEGLESVVDLPQSEDWLAPPGSEEAAAQARERERVNLGSGASVVGEPAAASAE